MHFSTVPRFMTIAIVPLLVRLVLGISDQVPLLPSGSSDRNVSVALFSELEELARIVDISYCVGATSLGISKPFKCLSRCSDFPEFELTTTWNTGPLASDSCGFIAADHGKERIILAFRGTYSIANTIVDLSTVPQNYEPYPGSDDGDQHPSSPRCLNCTVHQGFYTAWSHTRKIVLEPLEELLSLHPHYGLHLVGHSLGGAVAALAGLEFQGHGWNPTVTTFGEPRIGNSGLVKYIDDIFDLNRSIPTSDTSLKYRRVTHVDDPVPLLPLSEWDYAMHAGEIHISKFSLSPDLPDVKHCQGDNDASCIAGQDSTVRDRSAGASQLMKRELDLVVEAQDDIYEIMHEPWGIPSRYKLWQLFFAHRDYFWRIGLCVPGGDPLGGGGKYEDPPEGSV